MNHLFTHLYIHLFLFSVIYRKLRIEFIIKYPFRRILENLIQFRDIVKEYKDIIIISYISFKDIIRIL